MGTKIEWTDETWNPTTGCDRVSPGCDRCYAMTLAKRLKAMGSHRYQTDGDPATSGPGFGFAMHRDALDKPLRWTRPRRIFVNSMSDLFHADMDMSFLYRVFAVMALSPQFRAAVSKAADVAWRIRLERIDLIRVKVKQHLAENPQAPCTSSREGPATPEPEVTASFHSGFFPWPKADLLPRRPPAARPRPTQTAPWTTEDT